MVDKRNAAGDIFPPAVYTGTMSKDMPNEDGKYGVIVLDVEAVGTGTLTLTIRGRMRSPRATNSPNGSFVYYTILTGAAVSGVSTNVYRVGPALTAAANLTVNDVLPLLYNVEVVKTDTSAWTYSVQYQIVE